MGGPVLKSQTRQEIHSFRVFWRSCLLPPLSPVMEISPHKPKCCWREAGPSATLTAPQSVTHHFPFPPPLAERQPLPPTKAQDDAVSLGFACFSGSLPLLCLQTHLSPTPVARRGLLWDWLGLYNSLPPLHVHSVLHTLGSPFLYLSKGGWCRLIDSLSMQLLWSPSHPLSDTQMDRNLGVYIMCRGSGVQLWGSN